MLALGGTHRTTRPGASIPRPSRELGVTIPAPWREKPVHTVRSPKSWRFFSPYNVERWTGMVGVIRGGKGAGSRGVSTPTFPRSQPRET